MMRSHLHGTASALVGRGSLWAPDGGSLGRGTWQDGSGAAPPRRRACTGWNSAVWNHCCVQHLPLKRATVAGVRWLIASIGAGAVPRLTFPVLATRLSDGLGECTSTIELQTLGN